MNNHYPNLNKTKSSWLSLSRWRRPQQRVKASIIIMTMVLIFVFPFITWALDPSHFLQGQSGVVFNKQPIIVPSELGSVTSYFQGQKKLVIHIQDLHCHYEVQMHIAKLIEKMAKTHNLKLIGIEGADQSIRPEQLRLFPLTKIKKEVADYFVREGKLSGAEYYAITGKREVALEGIETAALYQSNLDGARQILNDEVLGYAYDLKDNLEGLKPKIYNQALLKFDHHRSGYQHGKISLYRYARYLITWAKKSAIDMKSYEQLISFVIRNQTNLDKGIFVDRLISQIEKLDQQCRYHLYSNQVQQDLDLMIRRLEIVEKLLNLSATQEDLSWYRQNPKQFSVSSFARFISHHQPAFKLESDLYQLDHYLRKVQLFYQVADKRSQHFVDNLKNKMVAQGEEIAVLITGGYHTDHVLAQLKKDRLSYISIKPKLTKQDLINPYFSLLKNKRTPLEKLLAQDQKILAVAPHLPQGKDVSVFSDLTRLGEQQRLFYELNRLYLAVKSKVYIFLHAKDIEQQEKRVGAYLQQLGQPIDHNRPWLDPQGVNVYRNNVKSFPANIANDIDAIAVVWPGNQLAPIDQSIAIDQSQLGKDRIAIIPGSMARQVKDQLALMPPQKIRNLSFIKLFSWKQTVNTSLQIMGKIQLWLYELILSARVSITNAFKQSWQDLKNNPIYLINITLTIVALLLLPMMQDYFNLQLVLPNQSDELVGLSSKLPIGLAMMVTVVNAAVNNLSEKPTVEKGQPKIDQNVQHVINRLNDKGWVTDAQLVNLWRALEHIGSDPDNSKALDVILQHLMRMTDNEPYFLFTNAQRVAIVKEGWGKFEEKIWIWNTINRDEVRYVKEPWPESAGEDEPFYLNGETLKTIFIASKINNKNWKLYYQLFEDFKILGQARILKSKHNVHTIRKIYNAFGKPHPEPVIMGIVIDSELEANEIIEHRHLFPRNNRSEANRIIKYLLRTRPKRLLAVLKDNAIPIKAEDKLIELIKQVSDPQIKKERFLSELVRTQLNGQDQMSIEQAVAKDPAINISYSALMNLVSALPLGRKALAMELVDKISMELPLQVDQRLIDAISAAGIVSATDQSFWTRLKDPKSSYHTASQLVLLAIDYQGSSWLSSLLDYKLFVNMGSKRAVAKLQPLIILYKYVLTKGQDVSTTIKLAVLFGKRNARDTKLILSNQGDLDTDQLIAAKLESSIALSTLADIDKAMKEQNLTGRSQMQLIKASERLSDRSQIKLLISSLEPNDKPRRKGGYIDRACKQKATLEDLVYFISNLQATNVTLNESQINHFINSWFDETQQQHIAERLAIMAKEPAQIKILAALIPIHLNHIVTCLVKGPEAFESQTRLIALHGAIGSQKETDVIKVDPILDADLSNDVKQMCVKLVQQKWIPQIRVTKLIDDLTEVKDSDKKLEQLLNHIGSNVDGKEWIPLFSEKQQATIRKAGWKNFVNKKDLWEDITIDEVDFIRGQIPGFSLNSTILSIVLSQQKFTPEIWPVYFDLFRLHEIQSQSVITDILTRNIVLEEFVENAQSFKGKNKLEGVALIKQIQNQRPRRVLDTIRKTTINGHPINLIASDQLTELADHLATSTEPIPHALIGSFQRHPLLQDATDVLWNRLTTPNRAHHAACQLMLMCIENNSRSWLRDANSREIFSEIGSLRVIQRLPMIFSLLIFVRVQGQDVSTDLKMGIIMGKRNLEETEALLDSYAGDLADADVVMSDELILAKLGSTWLPRTISQLSEKMNSKGLVARAQALAFSSNNRALTAKKIAFLTDWLDAKEAGKTKSIYFEHALDKKSELEDLLFFIKSRQDQHEAIDFGQVQALVEMVMTGINRKQAARSLRQIANAKEPSNQLINQLAAIEPAHLSLVLSIFVTGEDAAPIHDAISQVIAPIRQEQRRASGLDPVEQSKTHRGKELPEDIETIIKQLADRGWVPDNGKGLRREIAKIDSTRNKEACHRVILSQMVRIKNRKSYKLFTGDQINQITKLGWPNFTEKSWLFEVLDSQHVQFGKQEMDQSFYLNGSVIRTIMTSKTVTKDHFMTCYQALKSNHFPANQTLPLFKSKLPFNDFTQLLLVLIEKNYTPDIIVSILRSDLLPNEIVSNLSRLSPNDQQDVLNTIRTITYERPLRMFELLENNQIPLRSQSVLAPLVAKLANYGEADGEIVLANFLDETFYRIIESNGLTDSDTRNSLGNIDTAHSEATRILLRAITKDKASYLKGAEMQTGRLSAKRITNRCDALITLYQWEQDQGQQLMPSVRSDIVFSRHDKTTILEWLKKGVKGKTRILVAKMNSTLSKAELDQLAKDLAELGLTRVQQAKVINKIGTTYDLNRCYRILNVIKPIGNSTRRYEVIISALVYQLEFSDFVTILNIYYEETPDFGLNTISELMEDTMSWHLQEQLRHEVEQYLIQPESSNNISNYFHLLNPKVQDMLVVILNPFIANVETVVEARTEGIRHVDAVAKGKVKEEDSSKQTFSAVAKQKKKKVESQQKVEAKPKLETNTKKQQPKNVVKQGQSGTLGRSKAQQASTAAIIAAVAERRAAIEAQEMKRRTREATQREEEQRNATKRKATKAARKATIDRSIDEKKGLEDADTKRRLLDKNQDLFQTIPDVFQDSALTALMRSEVTIAELQQANKLTGPAFRAISSAPNNWPIRLYKAAINEHFSSDQLLGCSNLSEAEYKFLERLDSTWALKVLQVRLSGRISAGREDRIVLISRDACISIQSQIPQNWHQDIMIGLINGQLDPEILFMNRQKQFFWTTMEACPIDLQLPLINAALINNCNEKEYQSLPTQYQRYQPILDKFSAEVSALIMVGLAKGLVKSRNLRNRYQLLITAQPAISLLPDPWQLELYVSRLENQLSDYILTIVVDLYHARRLEHHSLHELRTLIARAKQQQQLDKVPTQTSVPQMQIEALIKKAPPWIQEQLQLGIRNGSIKSQVLPRITNFPQKIINYWASNPNDQRVSNYIACLKGELSLEQLLAEVAAIGPLKQNELSRFVHFAMLWPNRNMARLTIEKLWQQPGTLNNNQWWQAFVKLPSITRFDLVSILLTYEDTQLPNRIKSIVADLEGWGWLAGNLLRNKLLLDTGLDEHTALLYMVHQLQTRNRKKLSTEKKGKILGRKINDFESNLPFWQKIRELEWTLARAFSPIYISNLYFEALSRPIEEALEIIELLMQDGKIKTVSLILSSDMTIDEIRANYKEFSDEPNDVIIKIAEFKKSNVIEVEILSSDDLEDILYKIREKFDFNLPPDRAIAILDSTLKSIGIEFKLSNRLDYVRDLLLEWGYPLPGLNDDDYFPARNGLYLLELTQIGMRKLAEQFSDTLTNLVWGPRLSDHREVEVKNLNSAHASEQRKPATGNLSRNENTLTTSIWEDSLSEEQVTATPGQDIDHFVIFQDRLSESQEELDRIQMWMQLNDVSNHKQALETYALSWVSIVAYDKQKRIIGIATLDDDERISYSRLSPGFNTPEIQRAFFTVCIALQMQNGKERLLLDTKTIKSIIDKEFVFMLRRNHGLKLMPIDSQLTISWREETKDTIFTLLRSIPIRNDINGESEYLGDDYMNTKRSSKGTYGLGQWPIFNSFYKQWEKLLIKIIPASHRSLVSNVIAPVLTEGLVLHLLITGTGLHWQIALLIWYGLHINPQQLTLSSWTATTKQIFKQLWKQNLLLIYLMTTGLAMLVLMLDLSLITVPLVFSSIFSIVHLINNYLVDGKNERINSTTFAQQQSDPLYQSGYGIAYSSFQKKARRILRAILFTPNGLLQQWQVTLRAGLGSIGQNGLAIGQYAFWWIMILLSHIKTTEQSREFSQVELLRLQSELSIIRFSKTGVMFTPKIKPLHQLNGNPLSRIRKFIHGQAWSLDENKQEVTFYLPNSLLRLKSNTKRELILNQLSHLIIEHGYEQEALGATVDIRNALRQLIGHDALVTSLAKNFLADPIINQYYTDHQPAKQRFTQMLHRLFEFQLTNRTQHNWIKAILNEMLELSEQSKLNRNAKLAMLKHLTKLNLPKTAVALRDAPQEQLTLSLPKIIFENRHLLNLFQRNYPSYRLQTPIIHPPRWQRQWKNAA